VGTWSFVRGGIDPLIQTAAEDGVQNAHRVLQADVAHRSPLSNEAGVQKVALDVRIFLEDIVKQVGVLCAVTRHKRIVKEHVFDLACLSGVTGRGFHGLPQHHERGGFLVRQFGDRGKSTSPGDEEQVIDTIRVDGLRGVHKIAAFHHRPAVGRPLHIEKVNRPVGFDPHVFQECLPFEARIIGLKLIARVQAIRFDDNSTGSNSRNEPLRGVTLYLGYGSVFLPAAPARKRYALPARILQT